MTPDSSAYLTALREVFAQHGLTPRRTEFACLACLGRSNAEIAAELSVTQKTVRTNLKLTYRLFGVRSRAQLIVRCWGLVIDATLSGAPRDVAPEVSHD